MAQTIENDGVPPVTGVQRRVPRLPQQVLGVLHRCAQAEAYAQQAVAGGEAAAENSWCRYTSLIPDCLASAALERPVVV